MQEVIGTAYYIAPEVLAGQYTEACDMWSIGVITYVLLAGYPPFNAENENKVYKKIRTCDYYFHEEDWAEISEEAMDFIRYLLKPQANKRLTPDQALNHPWIQRFNHETPSKTVMDNLLAFQQKNKFQKEILLTIASF